MENLLRYIHSLTNFSDESWGLLQPALSKKKFKKNELLLKAGQVCNSLFYIDEGYCKSFYEVDGVIKNTGFFFENSVATNVKSFGNGSRSEFSIMACEPVTAILFDREKLFKAASQSPEIETLGRHCIRLFASTQEEFATMFNRYNAEDRLTYIEKNHRQILERVQLTQLASFLGIARETLSRIRKRRMIK